MNRGYYIEPTVFGNVDNHSTIAREEIFGPVLSVIPADNEAHAIEIANDTIYGLNASVFTNDIDRAYAAGRQLRTGRQSCSGVMLARPGDARRATASRRPGPPPARSPPAPLTPSGGSRAWSR
jgi:acyl-CoA reductase-like NAD-dependent aldehyde dehydrogenase